MVQAYVPGGVAAAAVDKNYLEVARLGKQALQGLRQGTFFVIGRITTEIIQFGSCESFSTGVDPPPRYRTPS